MSEAMYELIYLIDTGISAIFKLGLLYLIHKYIKIRRLIQ